MKQVLITLGCILCLSACSAGSSTKKVAFNWEDANYVFGEVAASSD